MGRPKGFTEISADGARFCDRERPMWGGGGSAERAMHHVYHALQRHIGRHVAPQANARIARLIALQAPSALGQQIAKCQKDRLAWAFLLWLCSIEPNVLQRRWGKRAGLPQGGSFARQSVHLDFGQLLHHLPVSIDREAKSKGQAQWLQWHAAETVLLDLWGRAVSAAEDMAACGFATRESRIEADPPILKGQVRADGSATFRRPTGSVPGRLPPAPRSSKHVRRERQAKKQSGRSDSLNAVARSPCLRFSWENGWQVMDAAKPHRGLDGQDIRRFRLFEKGRPHAYLIRTAEGFVGRLVAPSIEVVDTTAWKAIDLLRAAYRRHCEQFAPREAETASR